MYENLDRYKSYCIHFRCSVFYKEIGVKYKREWGKTISYQKTKFDKENYYETCEFCRKFTKDQA